MTISSHYPLAKVNLSHVAHSSPPLKKILKSFLSLLGVFFCLSLSDSPITQTVPVLSSWCLRVKFIPFTIDFRGGAFLLLGQRGTLKLFIGKKYIVPTKVSLNCFCQAAVRSINPWNCFSNDRNWGLIFFVLHDHGAASCNTFKNIQTVEKL